MLQLTCKTASKQEITDFFMNNDVIVAKDGVTGAPRARIFKEDDEEVWYVNGATIDNLTDLVQDSIDHNMILEAF